MISYRIAREFAVVLVFAALPSLAFAGTTDFQVLFDTDGNAATGCTVAGMRGVEQVHLTRVSDDDTSPRITQTHRQICTAGALGGILDLDTASRPGAAFRSTDRQLTLETRVPFSLFGAGDPEGIRVGFVATRDSAVHAATQNADGTSAVIPLRARMHAAGGAGRAIVMDGSLADWGRIEPILFGIQDGGSQALRLVRILSYASNSDKFLYFAAVARLASDAPFADEDLYLRDARSSVSILPPGVLQNDGDPLGQPLTAVKISEPERGTVTLNSDGGFTYTPNIPGYDAEDEFEYKARAGSRESNVARVRISVRNEGAGLQPVDDAYSTPEDVTLTVPAATGVLANDPPVGGAASAVLVTAPSHGTLTLNADGGFTYKPAKNFFGVDTFVYSFRVGAAAFGNATVTITVTSGNDSPTVNPATFSVIENSPVGTPVGTVTFSDPDAGDGHTFSITGGNTGGAFAINPGTGQITVAGPLNYEAIPSYSLTVRVQDDGSPSRSDTATIIINIINDNEPPVAVNNSYSTLAGQALVVPAPGVLANDTDPDGNSLIAVNFSTPANGGLVSNANGGFTYTPNSGFSGIDTFTYQASDGAQTSNTATVTIQVNQAPAITSANSTGFSAGVPTTFTVTTTGFPVPSLSHTGTLPVGATFTDNGNGTATIAWNGANGSGGVYTITITATNIAGSAPQTFTITVCNNIVVTNPANATGAAGSPFSATFTQTGAVGTATFTLASGTLPAGMTLATNGTLSGTPTQSGSFPITVRVTDANGCTGTSATYTLVITCQTITVTNPANGNGTAGSAFSETFTQTGGVGATTFSVASGTLPAGLTLASNGVLSGTPTQTGTFPITVRATDVNGCTGTGPTYTIVIGCQVISVTNPANGNGTASSAFSETFTQTGGIGTTTFTLASGTLPAGLTLASNGVLSGIPTQTGSFPVTVTATDSNGCTGTGTTYTIVIGCQVINITNPSNTAGTASAPFSETFTQTGAIGTPVFTTASTLPAGLSLASNGVLSGTPTQTGTFPIVVTVTDANGCTGTGATYSLVIACQTITVTNPSNTAGTVNASFSETFTQSGAIGSATFTLASGTLPAGLTLAANGVLSGTPTQTGSFPITVTVTDANGCTGTGGTYTIVIACQTITVTNPANATGAAGSPFSETFTQTGAIGSATFTLASGTLPAGLTLAANGVLSGTPSQGGSFPITVTVTDANGCTGTGATYTIVITCPTITVTNPANANGTANSAFSETFTSSGGVGTMTYTLASGTLPAGLTLAANGVLSGTPTQTGSFPITVTATDANGCTGTGGTYTIVIGCQTITVTNPANGNGTANSAFSETFTNTGAIGTTTYTLASGALPAGLTLASNGVLSGTPTQTGSFPITVTATDANGCTGTGSTYTIVIGCQTITVTNPSNANGTINVAFSETFTQTGAIGSATFTTASTLPAGLTLATNGVLSGTPTQTGSFPITVTVTDANGCTGTSATYTLVIGCQTITVTNPANANGTVGSVFSETFTQSGANGTATFTLGSGTLPAGITLAANGVLSGTPTQAGNFPITVTVTDSNGCTGTSSTYTLVIACQTITVTKPANTNGTVDAAFSETFTQSGGIGTTTFSTSSTLPSGLTLSSGGVLSGTPGEDGTFNIVVVATDSNGCTGTSSTYTLVIACQTITVSNPATATGTVDAAFNQTFTQTGVGTHTPITWSLSGTLPSGLTFNTSTGVLSGTPGQPGTFPVTVTATDVNGCSGTGPTYNLVIACQTITVTNPATNTATVGTAFSQTFTQSGVGTHTPAVWSVTGTLPAGITMNTSTGVLSGTPTQTGTFPITVTVTDANGCAGTGATYTLSVAPVAVADSFSNAVSNTQYVLTGGTTATPSTPSIQVAGTIEVNDLPSAATVTVTSGTFATSAGGSVTIAADGTFLYSAPAQPGVAPSATDTFTYTVSSDTGGTGTPVTSAPATVTINLTNRVWYVKNDSPAGGNGTSQAPFDTLAEAQTASTTNDIIYVYFGNGTNSGQNSGIVLKDGQKLYGQGLALVVNAQTLVAAGSQPLIGHSAGVGVTVTNISGVQIKGLNIAGSTDAILVSTTGANSGGVEIANNTISSAGNEGIDANHAGSGTMTLSIHDNVLTSTGAAINIIRAAGGGTVTVTAFDDNVVTATSTGGINVQGTGGVVTFPATVAGGITTIGTAGDRIGAAGLVLNNVAGALSFTDLDIFTDSGTALLADGGTGGFAFTVTPSASTIVANAGGAVSMTDITGLDLQLGAMTSTNSPVTGVSLVNTTGTFSAPTGSSITNATGTDFNISGGTVNSTYNGTIYDNTGTIVAVASSTAGTKIFAGAIDDLDGTGDPIGGGTANNGGGISLTNNTGATIRFNGGIDLSTGTTAAFTATGGGTVEVCDEAGCNGAATGTLVNKLTTTTATALYVANTSIGAGDLEFRSISANGGTASGIILNTTGNTGGLSVKGSGTAGSGGTIANKTGTDGNQDTGTGIHLNAVGGGVSFSRMQLNDFGNFAIFGSTVSGGFNLDNSVISGVNGTTDTLDEGSIHLNNLTGSGTMTQLTISGGFENNVKVYNNTGTLDRLVISNVTIGANSTGNGNDALNIEGDATAVVKATVQNSVFTSSRGDLFQMNHIGTGVGDLIFTGNTLSNNHPAIATGGGGVTLGSGSTSTMTMNLDTNTMRDAVGHAVLVVKDVGTGSLSLTFNNNDIGVAGTANSGSLEGAGLKVQHAGQGTMTALITNNEIRQYNNEGLLMQAGAGVAHPGTFNLTVSNNIIANPGTNAAITNVFQGLMLNNGVTVGDSFVTCLNLGANTINGSGRNLGVDFRLRARQSTTVRLPQYTGAFNDTAAVTAYAQARIGGAPTGSAVVDAASSGFVNTAGGAPCATP